jgi:hypothetical protein
VSIIPPPVHPYSLLPSLCFHGFKVKTLLTLFLNVLYLLKLLAVCAIQNQWRKEKENDDIKKSKEEQVKEKQEMHMA